MRTEERKCFWTEMERFVLLRSSYPWDRGDDGGGELNQVGHYLRTRSTRSISFDSSSSLGKSGQGMTEFHKAVKSSHSTV